MSSHDVVTLSDVPSHLASSNKFEVRGDSWGMPISDLRGDRLSFALALEAPEWSCRLRCGSSGSAVI